MHQFRCNSPRQDCINLWKVAGALVNPKGMHSHSQKPSGPMVNAVRGLASSLNTTCQYPDFKSCVENHTAPCKQSKVSSILGNEYPSFSVLLFNLQRSISETKPSIFLSYQHHSTGPWTKTPHNCLNLQLLLKVILHLLIQVRLYPSLPFLETLWVSYFDIMFQNIAFA